MRRTRRQLRLPRIRRRDHIHDNKGRRESAATGFQRHISSQEKEVFFL
jgi:hypothetical protein